LDFTKVIKSLIAEESDLLKYYNGKDPAHWSKLGNSVLAEAMDTHFKLHES
jgi:hypothetical protein